MNEATTVDKSLKPIIVACDESGNDGKNLLTGSTSVFTHASVTMTKEKAARIIKEVRAKTGNQSVELKSKTLLDRKH